MSIFNSELVSKVREFEKADKKLSLVIEEFEKCKQQYISCGNVLKEKIESIESKSKNVLIKTRMELSEEQKKLSAATLDFALMESNNDQYNKNLEIINSRVNVLRNKKEALEVSEIDNVHNVIIKEIETFKELAIRLIEKRNNVVKAAEESRNIIDEISMLFQTSRNDTHNIYVQNALLGDDALLRNPMQELIGYMANTRVALNIHEEHGIDMNNANVSFGECPKDVKQYPTKAQVYSDYITKNITYRHVNK